METAITYKGGMEGGRECEIEMALDGPTYIQDEPSIVLPNLNRF